MWTRYGLIGLAVVESRIVVDGRVGTHGSFRAMYVVFGPPELGACLSRCESRLHRGRCDRRRSGKAVVRFQVYN